ncbi:hypothetical protein LCGC14_0430490 [marine sediment metagenome]|uniref:Single-stranded DNA-binding protein n=1 Tax=marine sediment metagenome TaxID=412755 RepID=A0A0F9VAA1_9ZZZZ
MSLQVNKVMLAGVLGRDPEVRYTPSGTAITSASMAVNRRYKGKDDQWKEEVTWVSLDIWGPRGEAFGEHMYKGKSVWVEGHLKEDTWEDKQTGKKRSKLKVVVDNWSFVESKNAEDGGGKRSSGDGRRDDRDDRGGRDGGGDRDRGRGGSRQDNYDEPPDGIDDEDVPF